MQISIELFIFILSIVLTLIGTLVRAVRTNDLKRIEILEKKIELVGKLSAKFQVLDETVETLKKLNDHVEEAAKLASSKEEARWAEWNRRTDEHFKRTDDNIVKINDIISDVRETIAGFGGTYVSRKEYDRNQ